MTTLTLSRTPNVVETSAPTDERTVTERADRDEWTVMESPVTEPTSGARGLQRALDCLAEFAHLAPDWDSYGGRPPTAEAIRNAQEFLTIVHKRLGRSQDPRVLPDLIAPLADGGVHLRWRGAQSEMQVEFAPQGSISYLHIDRHGSEERYEEEDNVPWTTVIALIAKVLFP